MKDKDWTGPSKLHPTHLIRDERLHIEDLDEEAAVRLVPPDPGHHQRGSGLVVLQLPVNLLQRNINAFIAINTLRKKVQKRKYEMLFKCQPGRSSES